MTVRPRRSVLYMPGTNERALEKAKQLPADALILDLEDSVAPEAKTEARARVCTAVGEGGYGSRELAIRVNTLGTEWGGDDLAAVAASGADAVCVPKVERVEDVTALRAALAAAGAPSELAIWAMIETPLGVINVASIAAAGAADRQRLTVFIMGTNDLVKETRAGNTPDRWPLLPALSACLMAARAHGMDILDGVYNNFRDIDGFAAECRHGKALGMDGKTLIHPAQIELANQIFAPATEEVDRARAIISAFEQPENAGKGVINLGGEMVELLHRDAARRIVSIADAIGGSAE